MSITKQTNEEFNVSAKYNPAWNKHYDFSNPKNIAEIEKMARYDEAFAAGDQEYLKEAERGALNGSEGYNIGVAVASDWGINKVVDFRQENGEDVCIKEITVFANNMLSLQNHRGRQEKWEVLSGTLSAIVDGDLYDVSSKGVFKVTSGTPEKISDNNYIELKKGSIHCMINRSDSDVVVKETQTGITREADNNRYADQQRTKEAPRATIPLTSQALYDSAQLYWKIEKQIAAKPGLNFKVSYEPSL